MNSPQPYRDMKGPIYGFRRGYDVNRAGRHENADQFACFEKYLLLQGDRTYKGLQDLTGRHQSTLKRWAEKYKWAKRAAAYDKDQMAVVYKEVEKVSRRSHRDAVIEFRQSSEAQAKMLAKVSEDLMVLIAKRLQQVTHSDEEIPIGVVANLIRSASSASEQSRQAWSSALGVTEMMEIVEQEMERVEIEEITDVDAYEIPLDE